MIYRLYFTGESTSPNAATTVDSVPGWSFVFDKHQSLYQKFKKDLEEGAELQDADGKKMTKAKVTAFLKTLP